jgi:CHASE1-domain containing sensor protein
MQVFGRFATLAAVYWLTGLLALPLTTPPGYATAVWPPAGAALAGILLFGYRLWPAVLLGSFLASVWTVFDSANWASITSSFTTAMSIGLGASLQAVVGAYLVRRFAHFPNPLAGGPEIFRFFLFGGPISCAINATWGSATLLGQGIIQSVQYPFNWWTWWVGDTIGVLIFAPLFILLASDAKQGWNRRRKLSVSIPLGLGLLGAVLIFILTSGWETNRVRLEFEQRANTRMDLLRGNIRTYTNILESLQALFRSSVDVDRDEFRTFVESPLSRFYGIKALSWNPLVRADQQGVIQKAARQNGLDHFQIFERGALGERVRAGHRSEFVPIFYSEPVQGNETIVGFDVASDPARSEALKLARDSGEARATRRVTLLQENGSKTGVIMFAPVYANRMPHASVEERRRHLRGYVAAVFRISDMIESAVPRSPDPDIDLVIYDETASAEERLLYGNPQQSRNLPKWSTLVDVAGRQWRFEFVASPAYYAAHQSWDAWMVLAGTLAFTGLLGILFLLGTGRTFQIEQLVTERTSQLGETNTALKQKIDEQTRTEEELRWAHRQVTEKAQRLARFARQTAGRELRMVELKKEVNDLLRALDRPEKYSASEKHSANTDLV